MLFKSKTFDLGNIVDLTTIKGVSTRSKPNIKPTVKPLKVVTAFYNLRIKYYIDYVTMNYNDSITLAMIIQILIYYVIVVAKYESM